MRLPEGRFLVLGEGRPAESEHDPEARDDCLPHSAPHSPSEEQGRRAERRETTGPRILTNDARFPNSRLFRASRFAPERCPRTVRGHRVGLDLPVLALLDPEQGALAVADSAAHAHVDHEDPPVLAADRALLALGPVGEADLPRGVPEDEVLAAERREELLEGDLRALAGVLPPGRLGARAQEGVIPEDLLRLPPVAIDGRLDRLLELGDGPALRVAGVGEEPVVDAGPERTLPEPDAEVRLPLGHVLGTDPGGGELVAEALGLVAMGVGYELGLVVPGERDDATAVRLRALLEAAHDREDLEPVRPLVHVVAREDEDALAGRPLERLGGGDLLDHVGRGEEREEALVVAVDVATGEDRLGRVALDDRRRLLPVARRDRGGVLSLARDEEEEGEEERRRERSHGLAIMRSRAPGAA